MNCCPMCGKEVKTKRKPYYSRYIIHVHFDGSECREYDNKSQAELDSEAHSAKHAQNNSLKGE